MSSFINRREALGLLGLGGVSLLSACGPSVKVSDGNSSGGGETASSSESASPSSSSSSASPSSSSSSASASKSASASPSKSASSSSSSSSDDYSGEHVGDVKFHNYAGDKGAAKVGTEERKTTGMPKPIEPSGMDVKTKEGFYKFTGYWVALWNYAVLTGDVDGLLDRMANASYNMQYQVLKAMYENNNGWVYPDSGRDTDLLKMQIWKEPVYKGPEPDTYAWYGYVSLEYSKVRNLLDDSKYTSDKSLSDFVSLPSSGNAFCAKFVDGKWKFLRILKDFDSGTAEKADINS